LLEGPSMTELGYGFFQTIPGASFADVVRRAKEALADEGFGILAEMDIQKTMEAKLAKAMPPYLVLGACHPPLASRALDADPHIGLLLPCNVVIREDAGGRVEVSMVHPRALFSLVRRAEVEPLAVEVEERLRRTMARIGEVVGAG
jgi:uncharacterized protein (DUF302 family)